MAKCKFTPTYTKVVANALWEQVTTTLNYVPEGTIKTPIQWNKTWRDLIKNVKNKISEEYMNGTGGGPPMTPPPPELDKTMDEKIIEILTPVAVEGNIEVPDAFIFEENITPNVFEEPKQGQIGMDHDYILTNPSSDGLNAETSDVDNITMEKRKAIISRKKYTKSSRLTDSIKNNVKFLTISRE